MPRWTVVPALLVLGLVTGCGGQEPDPSGSSSANETSRDGGPGLRVSAYVAPWNGEQGLAAWESGAGDVVSTVSPVWLNPKPDGDLVRQPPGATAEVVQQAGRAGGEVVPSISNFVDGRWDGELVGRIVAEPDLRRRHVEAITAAVEENGWDGVDLDYESLPREARDDFSRFVEELGGALRSADAALTVTVHAKTADSDEGPGAFQDWAALAIGADRVRIMAYDHAWSGSEPGSVAPLPWVRDVAAYAVDTMPAEKAELGIAAFGYDWDDSQGRSVPWAEAVALADRHEAEVRWDEAAASSWFEYEHPADGSSHTVWFEDARSARLKVAAAQEQGVNRVFLWQLAGADPKLWDVFAPG